MNRKAAIELSINFIVVIVISIVILAMGFVIFFNIKNSATSFVDKTDQQTQDRLRSLMLSNNDNVAVYPTDPTINRGDHLLIGLGVTNNLDIPENFTVVPSGVLGPHVLYYSSATADPIDMTNIDNWCFLGPKCNIIMSNTAIVADTLAPKDQVIHAILIQIPKDAKSGQYIITMHVQNRTGNTSTLDYYGVIKIYVTTP